MDHKQATTSSEVESSFPGVREAACNVHNICRGYLKFEQHLTRVFEVWTAAAEGIWSLNNSLNKQSIQYKGKDARFRVMILYKWASQNRKIYNSSSSRWSCHGRLQNPEKKRRVDA